MASTRNEEINKSAGNDVTVACTKCVGKTDHEVVVSVDQSGYAEEADIQWDSSYQVIRCKGCKTMSFRRASSTSEDYVQVGPDDWETLIDEKLYPSRVEGIKDLGNEVYYLPHDLRKIYSETSQALSSDSPVLTGIGLRALVETVCKEKNAAGGDLYSKINDLQAQHVLTPSGAKILHKVRTLGNKAAHEVKPHTPSQLALAMNVVEHMLKDVYILPKLVEDTFD